MRGKIFTWIGKVYGTHVHLPLYSIVLIHVDWEGVWYSHTPSLLLHCLYRNSKHENHFNNPQPYGNAP